MTVTVFTVPSCTQCNKTKEWLEKYNIEYDVVEARDTEGAAEFVASLGQMQMPMVLVHEGDWRTFQLAQETEDDRWYSFRPDKIWGLRKRLALVAA